jgi:hypothetical protein
MKSWRAGLAAVGGVVCAGLSVVIVLVAIPGTFLVFALAESEGQALRGLAVVACALLLAVLLFGVGVRLLSRHRPSHE